ncbi:related to GDP-Man:Man(3)GlcNAc(2)-PP-Dol alpha-1,2-mannosyltransferase [Saccharomycodes ludwigii]|uniref:GDP-Man:Man(3)GlcNAc(2)-PP-Dol alpha-1,2-mannosyltransferase n=1 Tax=Saccharomycodes ludwigii TaxID=36035 RepID=A0A376BB46_9ASCO|nr:hypothetical protein SCDLUD_002776 [Saccharomycodes ludwigii]KAH3901285.1 hypothetical protein SCDLUD_002776 [Saccharomycodes ludwigii]SSD61903.1 related to GDP-Man:Man(3)GlcNAc(2)-PP-Dol alpha-1,2-mannosyltransferase [Saccharomycodes ludwigii]
MTGVPWKTIVTIFFIIVFLTRESAKIFRFGLYSLPKGYITKLDRIHQKYVEFQKKKDCDGDESLLGKSLAINFGWKAGIIRRLLLLNTFTDCLAYSNYYPDAKTKNCLIGLNLIDREKYSKLRTNLLTNAGLHESQKRIIGIFHPYCNAGGGGEKVLWKIIEHIQTKYPQYIIAVYTGDLDVKPTEIIEKVYVKFGYKLNPKTLTFIYLTSRKYVDGSYWKHFTLLGQALSSLYLCIESLYKLPPDIFIDTMGYPFTYYIVRLFANVPVVSYTHYPIISDDMLEANTTGLIKKFYWKILMGLYKNVGNYVDISITNSSWTNNHMNKIWCSTNSEKNHIIYPPCSTELLVENLQKKMKFPPDLKSWKKQRKFQAVVVAQFRPEKRHELIIEQYAEYYHDLMDTKTNTLTGIKTSEPLRLLFAGSTRDKRDEAYVKYLRDKINNLRIPSNLIEFKCNLSYPLLQKELQESMFGLNAMWNEHFGIAIVEYVANGCIPIVHASAGPLLDIVIDNYKNGIFFIDPSDPDYNLRKDVQNYKKLAEAFQYIQEKFNTNSATIEELWTISNKGYERVLKKFGDEKFDSDWDKNVMEPLVTELENKYRMNKLKENPELKTI